MAINIEELQVLISANADQFKGELLSIRQELQKFGQSAETIGKQAQGSIFSNVLKANIATNILSASFQKFTGIVRGSMGTIINGGSQLSRLTVANDALTANLGMSREELQGFRDDLAESNTFGIAAEQIISSLALSGLHKLASSLEYVDARTGKTTKGMTALTLAIKDLAAARGMDSQQGIESITRFIQTGEASYVQGILELGNLGKAYNDFAKTIGKTNRTELTQSEEAYARLTFVQREATKSFGAYAMTYETSGKIFGSIGALIQNLMQTIGRGLEPVLRVGGSAILQFFRGIQQSLNNSAQSVENAMVKIAGWMIAIVRLVGRLGQNLPFVGAGFKRLAEFTINPIKAQGQMTQSTNNLGGAMDDTAEKSKALAKQMKTLAGFDELNVLNQPEAGGADPASAISPALGGMDIGGSASGAMADNTQAILDQAKGAEEAINKLLQPLKDLKDRMDEVTIFGKPLTEVLLDVAKFAGLAYLGFNILSSVFSPVIGLVASLVGGIGKLGAVFGFIFSPIGILVAIIGGLIAVFVHLYNTNEDFRKGVQLAWENIKKAIGDAWQWLQINVFAPLKEFFEKEILPRWNEFSGKVGEIFGKISAKFQELMIASEPLRKEIGEFLSEAFKILSEVLTWLWENVLSPIVDFLLDNLVPAFDVVINIVGEVIKVFMEITRVILEVATPILKALWEVIKFVFDAIATIVKWVWENVLRPIFEALAKFINEQVIPRWNEAKEKADVIFNAIGKIINEVWAGIQNAIQTVVNFILSIPQKFEEFKNGVTRVFEGVRSAVEGVWNGLQNMIKSGINWIIDRINEFIRGVNRLLDGLASGAGALGIQLNFRVGEIPKLANGGIVSAPSLVMAGEGGYKEAVLPLDRNTGWAERVAELISQNNGGSKGSHIVIQLGQETIFDKFVDYVNDKAVITNQNILNI